MNFPAYSPDEKELDRRIMIVRWCFERACGEINRQSDLGKALANAEMAKEVISRHDPGAKLQPDMGMAVSLIWRMGNTLQLLEERKIPFNQHLKVMKRGDTQFGQKDPPGKENFKDFELELYIAAQLCDRNVRPVELHEPGHPFDITFGGALRIECKQPSSEKGIAPSITEFSKALDVEGSYGAIVVGMEDALELGELPIVNTQQEVLAFAQAKLDAVMATKFKGWEKNLRNSRGILGVSLYATIPVYYRAGEKINFSLEPLTLNKQIRDSGCKEVDGILREYLTAMR